MSARANKLGMSRSMMLAVVMGTALSAAAPAASTMAGISRYCTACWRNARLPADCWPDCTQEVFSRLLERVPAGAWDRSLRIEGDERREFLRAIDAVKKRVQRGRRFIPLASDAVTDDQSAVERVRADLRDARWQAADELLSVRQQTIVRQTIEGYGVQDIAMELRMSPERVSDEKYKAIRKLRARLNPDCDKSLREAVVD